MAIRTKLAIWFSAWVAIVLLLFATVRYAGLREMLQEQKDYSLKVIAGILDASVPRKTPSAELVKKVYEKMLADFPDVELKGIIMEVYSPSRSIIYSSSITVGERLPLTDDMWDSALSGRMGVWTVSVDYNRSPLRIFTRPVLDRKGILYLIQLGSSMQDIEAALEHFFFLNLLFIPLATLIAGLGSWFLTRKALRPLDVLVRSAHHISSGDLSHRIEEPRTGREIQELAQSFNQMTAKLEASFHQIRHFSENVSHELRIPLSILRGQSELSLRRYRSEEEYRRTLESNLEEIHRMEQIVERLLFLSKTDRGEIHLNLANLELGQLLREVHSRFEAAAKEKKIHLALKGGDSLFMRGDELFLRELLLNLVQNAINHTSEGGEVTLFFEKADTHISLGVVDTGCGIPEDEIPHIFDRFYKVDKSRSSQGIGLGLSLCKWIVEAHRGSITVDSTLGKGSRFTILFPISPASKTHSA